MKRSRLRRRGKRAERESESLAAFREAVLGRGECERCGARSQLTPHHRLPRSRGGKHDPANGVCLCWICHRWVHDHAVADWSDWLDGKETRESSG